jgi:hypothetical protein
MSARRLWTALAVGPMGWMLTLTINATLSDLGCGPGIRGRLIGIALLMLAFDIAAGAVAWRAVRSSPPLEHDPGHERHLPFLAHFTLLSCALFAVAIAAHLVPPALLHDCR